MLLEGQLHMAPLDTPHRILDVGTGTGIWAVDAAERWVVDTCWWALGGLMVG